MYPNLAAEMARKGVKQKDIAEILHTRTATVSAKLNGKSPLLIEEAKEIKAILFPNHSLDYLFERNNTA